MIETLSACRPKARRPIASCGDDEEDMEPPPPVDASNVLERKHELDGVTPLVHEMNIDMRHERERTVQSGRRRECCRRRIPAGHGVRPTDAATDVRLQARCRSHLWSRDISDRSRTGVQRGVPE